MNHVASPNENESNCLNMPKYDKIVVIDDSEMDRFITQSAIKSAELTDNIVHFDRAQQAMEYLRSFEDKHDEFPGLIMLDLMMPDMTGFEFLIDFTTLPEELLERKSIVVFTSSIDPTDKELAHRFPFVKAFLTKPINRAMLEAM